MSKVRARRTPDDQKHFRHHSMKLERVGEALFGERYHKAIDRSDIQFWHKLYVEIFEVLGASALRSMGSVDPDHRKNIEEEIKSALSNLLQSYMHHHPREHGFSDAFDADYAYLIWTRELKKSQRDRSAYCEWMRERFPRTYALFR